MLKKLLLLAMFPIAAHAQDYKKIQEKAIFVDSHNDILTACIEKNVRMDDNLKGKTQSDLARFKEAGVDVQIFSVFCDGTQQNPYQWANREMDTLDAVISRNPDKITLTRNSAELNIALKQHKLAAMFGVEGGHMIEGDLNKLDNIYKRGARYMTLTWNNSSN